MFLFIYMKNDYLPPQLFHKEGERYDILDHLLVAYFQFKSKIFFNY
jgi:hypothetical protein